jgi:hypothetical protein
MSLLHERRRHSSLLFEGAKAAERTLVDPWKTSVAVFTHAILPRRASIAAFRPSFAVKRALVAVY